MIALATIIDTHSEASGFPIGMEITFSTYILFTASLVAWCTVHSLLISPGVSRYMERRLGPLFRYYRISYNIFSLLSLIFPLLFGLYLQSYEIVLFSWSQGWVVIRYGLLFCASALFYLGARHYDLRHFLGTAQMRSGAKSMLLSDGSDFVTSGISGVTRHPWYLGGIIFIWSAADNVYPSTLITACIVSAYFVIGSFLEERKLHEKFGQPYEDYQKEVSMLFPVKWLQGQLKIRTTRGN
ncbi:MAG: isoprenylcysteine carboxylmethyltransferase family protein [Deltaproteobacteria bacterium]|nr:isoprenylcysteine carboxylmethyltransferase family protein [Deltaproteobacteria bacterium]